MADLEVKMDASSQQPNSPHMDLEATLVAERDASADPGAEDVLSVHQDLGRPLDLFLPAPSDTEPGCWPPRPEEIRKDPVSPEESEQVSNPLPPSVQVSAGSSPGKSRDRIEEGDVQPQFDHEPGQSLTMDAGPAVETQSGPSETSGVDPSHLRVESEDREDDADLAKECPESDFVHLRGLFDRLQRLSPLCRENLATSRDGPLPASDSGEDGHAAGEDDERSLLLASAEDSGAASLLHIATGHGSGAAPRRLYRPAQRSRESHSLLSVDADREDLLGLLRYEGGVPEEKDPRTPLACSDAVAGGGLWEMRVGAENPDFSPGSVPGEPEKEGPHRRVGRENIHLEGDDPLEPGGETDHGATGSEPTCEEDGATKADVPSPAFKEGPCEAEDLLEGVIFGAKYLGSTQLISDRNPPTNIRMAQAQEAVDRIKAPEGESQPMTEVDLFVSTQRIKVLTADSQETMMDHSLQTISYIADIGNIVVLMARRRLPRRADTPAEKQLYKMICHVFHSTDAQVIAQAIGQAFSVAFQRFLEASGIDPSQLATRGRGKDDEEDALAKVEDLYNGDLAHFSKQENCKEVIIPKQKGEILGIVIVESGWGSILPTVVVANLMHRGAAERSGKLSIGDRIMSVNGTSLVGLPLVTCQSIIRDLKHQTEVTLCVVHCPPVTTAIVQRPDTKYPLGFCVENGIICSLMRGGIAERGGIRVGHRIIEINGQSVVAVPHEKIIEILTQAVSEVRIKTMPASTYRLLTGQEQPVFL